MSGRIARSRGRALALGGALLLSLLACGEAPPPPSPAKKVAPPPPPPPVESPQAAQATQGLYVYSPVGKRDPFQNVFAVKEVTPVKVPGGKPTPLQRWPIDKLKLGLTVTGTSSPIAMVEDPDGRGWTVKIGTFIGQNWGKVTSIQRDQIVITETITDHATGRVYPQDIQLKVVQDAVDLQSEQQLRDGEQLSASPSQGSRN